MMNIGSLIAAVVPGVIQALSHATTPGAVPRATQKPAEAHTAPVQTGGQNAPSEAVKSIQSLLKQFVDSNLEVDGWLGPATEKALKNGLAKAQPFMQMFGLQQVKL